MTLRILASEIVSATEKQLIEANKKKIQAFNLLKEASALEDTARLYALETMGPEKGLLAFEMASWSLENVDIQQALSTAVPLTEVNLEKSKNLKSEEVEKPVVSVKKENKTEDLPVNNKGTSKSIDLSKYFGENVPSSRISEADDILAQAVSYVSQGRKGNPFGNDRGKNAWRKSLFNAAYTHYASNNEEISSETIVDEVVNENIVKNIIVTETPFFEDDADFTSDDKISSISDEEDNVHSINDIIDDIDNMPIIDSDISHFDNESFIISPEENVDGDVFDTYDQISDDHSFGSDDLDSLVEDEIHEELVISEPNDYEEEVLIVSDDDKTDSPKILDIDPFDDMGELPPANTLPPPRGGMRSMSSPMVNKQPLEDKKLETVVDPPISENVTQSSVPKPFSTGMGGMRKPSSPVKVEDAVKNKVEVQPVAHTPQPIPSHRRAGNGQVLQEPKTLPAAISGMSSFGKKSPSGFTSIPSFAKK